MKNALTHGLSLLVVLITFTSLTNHAHAQRPGLGSGNHLRWFKARDAEKRPERGLLTARLEKRKAARKAAAAAKAPVTPKKNIEKGAARAPTLQGSKPAQARAETVNEVYTAKKVVRAPGRPGRGAGMIKRRRSVLKPLFGD